MLMMLTLDMWLSLCFRRRQLWRCRMHGGNRATRLSTSLHRIPFSVGMLRWGWLRSSICNNE